MVSQRSAIITEDVTDEVALQKQASAAGRLSIGSVKKEFHRKNNPDAVKAIDDVSLEVEPGTFVVLLGPSGCGKTTLLRCVAGLETPDSGTISINGKEVYVSESGINLPPDARKVSMMFQSYALWPHMTVLANVMYPIISQKLMNKADAKAQALHVLGIVGLSALANEHPGTLSGGQQQRVALARALAADPSVVLFDEPLSNVDAQVRDQLRLELSSMQARLGFTAMYVTHDQSEALALADVLILMGNGRIAQAGSPNDLYARPASRYVAEFIGRANLVDGTVRSVSGQQVTIATETGEIIMDAAKAAEGTRFDVGSQVAVVSRPEDIIVVERAGASNTLDVRVTNVVYLGSHVDVVGTVGTSPRLFRSTLPKGMAVPDVGAVLSVSLPAEHLWIVGE